MPRHNQFRHQSYPTVPRMKPTRHILHVHPEPVDFSRLHTQHSVHQVIVVPGTFAGKDPFNIAGTLRAVPKNLPVIGAQLHRVADRIENKTREVFSAVAGDTGNYTDGFIQRFEELVNGDPLVTLLDPTWTGQNHHFARADLAIRLLSHLDGQNVCGREQILLWGHSHAGNGFALLSNLLANHRQSVDRFFDVCGYPEADHWRCAHETLKASPSPHPLAKHVTAATFGAPVRYGWDTDGFNQLYHVLFDRGADDPEQIATESVFPPRLNEILNATYGDWVQAFAIAGTDVVPLAPSPVKRDRMIAELLLQGLDSPELSMDTRLIPVQHLRILCARWKTGTRCHADGYNLLVDYQPADPTVSEQPIESSVFGHGVATTLEWLPAHLALLIKRMDLTRAG